MLRHQLRSPSNRLFSGRNRRVSRLFVIVVGWRIRRQEEIMAVICGMSRRPIGIQPPWIAEFVDVNPAMKGVQVRGVPNPAVCGFLRIGGGRELQAVTGLNAVGWEQILFDGVFWYL